MRRAITRRAGHLAIATLSIAVGLALSASTAFANPPVNQIAPTIVSPNGAYVGDALSCDTGIWDSSNYTFQYQFMRGATIVQAYSFATDYTVQPADTGAQISCLVQADNGVDTPVSIASSNAITAGGPPPSLTLTLFSNAVSGSEGISPPGATTVSVVLQRAGVVGPPITVASDNSSVAGDGSWSLVLTPTVTSPVSRVHAFALGQDSVTVHYAGPGAPADQTVSNPNFLAASLSDIDLSSTGSSATFFPAFGADCATSQFVKDGVDISTSPAGSACQATFTPAVTDNNLLQVKSTLPLDNVGGVGDGLITGIAPMGLLPDTGEFTLSAPTCSGDLVDGTVTCSGLTGHSFTITRGADTVTLTSVGGNQATATLPGGLHTGDTVKLKEQGLGRVMTTLTVDPLREDLVDGAVTGGSCLPDEWLDNGAALCPANGNLATAGMTGASAFDDTSGGSTTLNIPDFASMAPLDGESVAGSFTAYADTVGPAPGSVSLTIHQRNANGSDGSQVAGPLNVAGLGGATVSSLAPGRYNAAWRLTDSNGDSRIVNTEFVVQSSSGQGSIGPPGPAGAAGSVGPQGPPGVNVSSVKCKWKPKGKKKRIVTCVVAASSALHKRVSVSLVRGHKRYASGSGIASGQQVIMHLRATRRLRSGKYVAMITLKDSGRTRHVQCSASVS